MEKQQEQDATECFICYDSFTEENPQATPNPCKCKGSIAIHLECLKTLMKHQHKCKSCNSIYNKMLYVNIYELIDIEFARENFYYLEKIEQTREICEYAFNSNHKCFKAIYDVYKTPEMCCAALLANEENIRYISKYMQTYEMVEPILKKSIRHIPYIKKDFIDSSLMTYYISNKEKSILKYFPKEIQTPENCKAIIRYDGSQIQYIRDDLKTQELEMLSLNTYTPSEYNFKKYSREIQKKIVKRNWHMIEYMENPSNALCVHIIKKHPEAIERMQKPSDELIALAIRLDSTIMDKIMWSNNKYFKSKHDFVSKKVIRMLGNKGIFNVTKWHGEDYVNRILKEMNIKKECITNDDNEIKIVSV